jgi:hypothetical protein
MSESQQEPTTEETPKTGDTQTEEQNTEGTPKEQEDQIEQKPSEQEGDKPAEKDDEQQPPGAVGGTEEDKPEVTEQEGKTEETSEPKVEKEPKKVKRSKSERVPVDPKVVHEGQAQRRTDLLGRWVGCWLSLEGDGEYLRWFKQQPGANLRKADGFCAVSNIADARQRFQGVGAGWPVQEFERCFVVGTQSKVYCFVAPSEGEKDTWLEKIKEAKAKVRTVCCRLPLSC